MSDQNIISLSNEEQVQALISYLHRSPQWVLEFDERKNVLSVLDTDYQKVFDIRAPLYLGPFATNAVQKVIESFDVHYTIHYSIMLIQAGHAALGVANRDRLLSHKVFAKYMVRKKQGKAQITHLKTKGKSRAGSRIRLANTIAFFEEINERLNEWHDYYTVSRILYYCTPQLWGLLFDSKIHPPFDKKDRRLIKIPEHVRQPNFKELQRVDHLVKKSIVKIYDKAYIPTVKNLLNSFGGTERYHD